MALHTCKTKPHIGKQTKNRNNEAAGQLNIMTQWWRRSVKNRPRARRRQKLSEEKNAGDPNLKTFLRTEWTHTESRPPRGFQRTDPTKSQNNATKINIQDFAGGTLQRFRLMSDCQSVRTQTTFVSNSLKTREKFLKRLLQIHSNIDRNSLSTVFVKFYWHIFN